MAKGVGGGGRPGRGGVTSALQRMMPAANLEDLVIGPGGLMYAKSQWGKDADTVMYNPKTGTLLAGAMTHASLRGDYALGQNYDDFVKIWIGRSVTSPYVFNPKRVVIFANRHAPGASTSTQWNMMFQAARALRSAGIAGDVTVEVANFGPRARPFTTFQIGEA